MSHYLPATTDLLPLRLALKKLYPVKNLGMVHRNLSLCHVTMINSSHWLRLHGVVTMGVVTIITQSEISSLCRHCSLLQLADDYCYLFVSNEVAVPYQVNFGMKSPNGLIKTRSFD